MINIGNFLQNSNLEGNSFQLSFYDISQKYIVSKRIMKVQHMNFSLLYGKYINDLTKYTSDLDLLREKESEFKNNASKLYENWINIYSRLTKNLTD